MTKLRALFLLVGTLLTGGGAVYSLALLQPGATVADAVDAGLLNVSVPGRLSCNVRILDACRQGANSGRPKYARVGVKARIVPDAGPGELPVVAFDIPDVWQPCVRFLGTPTEACTLVENGACTDVNVCANGAAPQVEVDACACRSDAGACLLVDGGPAPFGATLAPGWSGAGCVRKYCGPETAGEQGQSWPAGCP